MSDATHEEGGCLCGAVRYRITGPIDSVGHCHCGMCRRGSGGIVVTWITVPPERFAVIRGEPAVYESSANGRRAFCRDCGAQLTFRSETTPDEIDISLGTLDRPERYAADRHVYWTDRLPWLELDPALPKHPAGTPAE